MWLKKTAAFFHSLAHPSALVLNYLAATALVFLMILTGIDVTMRYVFNAPIPGSFEITQYVLPVVIAFGMAKCSLENGHVSVELLISRLPGRMRAFMKSIAYLLFTVLYGLITWQSLLRALGMKQTGQTSEVLAIPVYPFVLTVTVGSAVLCLTTIKDFFQYLFEAFKK
ncbi:MAG: TRAP transporter small permease [Deltaproteobacteria bacterium]|nr:TRAP transporter small permease [Deltaproteobacteria bacterium]